MYAYLKGVLTENNADGTVIECNGVGYCVQATDAFMRRYEIGEIVKIYVWQCVREDGISLFGFIDNEEKAMFLRLISVSGVGPKSALIMLSTMGVRAVAAAIVGGDIKALTRAQGIGTKMAQRIVLELRGSIENSQLASGGASVTDTAVSIDGAAEEAVEVICSLGIPKAEAMRRVASVSGCDSAEDIIRAVLKNMNGAG